MQVQIDKKTGARSKSLRHAALTCLLPRCVRNEHPILNAVENMANLHATGLAHCAFGPADLNEGKDDEAFRNLGLCRPLETRVTANETPFGDRENVLCVDPVSLGINSGRALLQPSSSDSWCVGVTFAAIFGVEPWKSARSQAPLAMLVSLRNAYMTADFQANTLSAVAGIANPVANVLRQTLRLNPRERTTLRQIARQLGLRPCAGESLREVLERLQWPIAEKLVLGLHVHDADRAAAQRLCASADPEALLRRESDALAGLRPSLLELVSDLRKDVRPGQDRTVNVAARQV